MRLTNQTSFLPLAREKAASGPLPLEGPHTIRPGRPPLQGRMISGPSKTETAQETRTRDACQKFEGFLLGEMLKSMRGEGSDGKGIVPTSRGERIFIRQQCETLGDILGRSEPLGMRRLLVGGTDQPRPADQDTAPSALPERGPA